MWWLAYKRRAVAMWHGVCVAVELQAGRGGVLGGRQRAGGHFGINQKGGKSDGRAGSVGNDGGEGWKAG